MISNADNMVLIVILDKVEESVLIRFSSSTIL